MKKLLPIVSLLLLVIATILPHGWMNKVEAATQYENGEYEVDYAVNVPTMGRYMEKPALVNIDEDQQTVTFRFNSQEFIEKLEIDKEGQWQNISQEERDDDFVEYTIYLDQLSADIPLKITIDAMGRIMEHEFNTTLDVSNIPEKEEEVAPSEDFEGEKTAVFFWHDSQNKASSMQNYVQDNVAYITEEAEGLFAIMTLNASDMVTDFGVEGQSAKVVSEDTDKNERTYKFPVSDINNVTHGFVEIDTQNPEFGKMSHAVRIYFGEKPVFEDDKEATKEPAKKDEKQPSKEPAKKDEKQPSKKPEKETSEKPKNSDNKKSQAPKNKDIIYKDGEYLLPAIVYKEDGQLNKSNISSMDDFIMREGNHLSKVMIKNGKATVFLPMSSADMIDKLIVEDQQAKRQALSNNQAVFSFPVKNLNKIQAAEIAVDTPIGYMEHNIRIYFDTSEVALEEGKAPPKDPRKIEKNTKTAAKQSSEHISQKQTKQGQNKPLGIFQEGKHQLPIVIYKAEGPTDASNLSEMNQYVSDDSYITVKNGQNTVTMILKRADLIKKFAINGTNIAGQNLSNNQIAFSFPVKDLTKLTHATIDVNVPGFGNMHHAIRIAFDTSNLPVNKGQTAPASFVDKAELKNQLGDIKHQTNVTNETEDQLSFDRHADQTSQIKKQKAQSSDQLNPKTADMNYSKISIFSVLFLMSALLLVFAIRKKFKHQST